MPSDIPSPRHARTVLERMLPARFDNRADLGVAVTARDAPSADIRFSTTATTDTIGNTTSIARKRRPARCDDRALK